MKTNKNHRNIIHHSWHNLITKDGREISEKVKRTMDIIRYLLVKKDYRKFKYIYFTQILKRSQDQVKKYFDEFKETGLGEIKFCRVLVREDGVKYRDTLEIELTEKGIKELKIKHLFSQNGTP